MTDKNKSKIYFSIATIFIVLSLFVFFMADGLRRWYSGIFFLIIGVVTLLKALTQQSNSKNRLK